MMNEILQEVACPNCQNPIDVRRHGKHVTCDACSSQFILRGRLCPHCSAYHDDEEPFCGECGAPLQRVCGKCHHNNWAGDEYCAHCGSALDILELLALQQKQARQAHEARRQAEIRALRLQEEEASRQRLAELEAVADAYRREIAQRRARRAAEDRGILFLVLLAGAIFVLVVVGYLLSTLL